MKKDDWLTSFVSLYSKGVKEKECVEWAQEVHLDAT
jgi:hypothetical protein